MITTVIFDIGNVLAAYDWEDALMRSLEVQTGMRWTGAF